MEKYVIDALVIAMGICYYQVIWNTAKLICQFFQNIFKKKISNK